jgi:hypothetical protein
MPLGGSKGNTEACSHGGDTALADDGSEPRAFAGPSRLDAAQVQRLAAKHLDALGNLDEAAQRVVDKMPDNYLCLGLLAVLFPKAKFSGSRPA